MHIACTMVLERGPLEGGLAWVDADRSSLDDHLRHTALPRPGGQEQLAALRADLEAAFAELQRAEPPGRGRQRAEG